MADNLLSTHLDIVLLFLTSSASNFKFITHTQHSTAFIENINKKYLSQ